jgi:hypothetical protein
MAKINGMTQTPLRFKDVDPAVAAARRVKYAGEDDAAYEIAIVALETAKPTTPAGIKALLKLYISRVEALQDGDVMSPEMVATMAKMARNIMAGLDHLARKAG